MSYAIRILCYDACTCTSNIEKGEECGGMESHSILGRLVERNCAGNWNEKRLWSAKVVRRSYLRLGMNFSYSCKKVCL